MDKDIKGHIRYLANTEKLSISEISRLVKVSRITVRRALTDENKARAKKVSKLDPYKEAIRKILFESPSISNKHLLEKITELGYSGQKSILGEYLQKIKKSKDEVYNNLTHLPGEEAQVDWGSCGTISVGEQNRKLYVFCIVLSYSRYMYMAFTTSMDMETFLACHIKAFRFFGGIPKALLYDNLKSVVSFRDGKRIVFNERFSNFANFYGFKIKACNVRRGNEKGIVERSIRYIKGDFLKKETYESFEVIKLKASLWLRDKANKRVHSVTRKRPLDMLINEEKSLLLPLSENDYDYALPRPLKARKDALFAFDANLYSIPVAYYGLPLSYKPYTGEIKIVYTDKIVAVHKRCYDKYQTIKNEEHYKELNMRKKKAAINQTIETFKMICPEAAGYLEGLMKNNLNTIHQIRQIISLQELFDKTAVAQAIARALKYKAFHWEYIKNILLENSRISPRPNTLLKDKEELMNIRIAHRDLAAYDEIN